MPIEDLFIQFSLVTQSYPTVCEPMDCSTPRPLCPSPSPRVYSNSCPLSQWCHPTVSSCLPLLLLLQSFPASGSFQMRQLFASGGQSIGVSASASFLKMNIEDWFSLGWTGWISLQSKGLSRVFSNTPFQKHQFGAQLSLQSGGCALLEWLWEFIHTRPKLGKNKANVH